MQLTLIRLLNIFFYCFLFCFAQAQFNGKVIDKKTKAPVPFATIGLLKENIGTNADEEGRFILFSQKQLANDSLVISCVAYETIKIPIQNFPNGSLIELNERLITLNEVKVKANYNWTVSTINKFSGCNNSTITTTGFQTQAAQHFTAPVANSVLIEVKVCCGNGIIYLKKSKFRIRIYDIDNVTGNPSADLTDQIIEVNSNGKQESINLEKFKIEIPHNEFFIAVEWLKNSMNAEKAESKAVGDTVYRPHIGFTENKNIKGESWSLFYNGKWSRNFSDDLQIAATIKY